MATGLLSLQGLCLHTVRQDLQVAVGQVYCESWEGWGGGWGAVSCPGWGALSLACSGPFCVSVCRPGCWPCWGSRAPMGPQAPGGYSPSRLCSAQRPPCAPQRFLWDRLKAFLPILSPSSRIYHPQPVLNPTPVLDQECGQGPCLSPGAQTPPGAGDACLLGESSGGRVYSVSPLVGRTPLKVHPPHVPSCSPGAQAAVGHGQPMGPVVRLLSPVGAGAAGAAAGRHRPRCTHELPLSLHCSGGQGSGPRPSQGGCIPAAVTPRARGQLASPTALPGVLWLHIQSREGPQTQPSWGPKKQGRMANAYPESI